MAKYRKVNIESPHRVPVNERALIKLIRYYYKGPRNVTIIFTNKNMHYWAFHGYCSKTQTHKIHISPTWCRFNKRDGERRDFENLISTAELIQMNDYDTTCRIINTVLHELKHAEQCDKNPIRYIKCTDDIHPHIRNASLKYELSPLEAEAEGWALINFNKALERYESWC